MTGIGLVLAVATVGAGAARDGAGAAPTGRAATAPPRPIVKHWLGRTFAGMAITHRDRLSVIYGDCDAADGGCTPPVEVQSWSICRRHPLEIDLLPSGIRRYRGALVVAYDDRREVLTGTTNAVIFVNDPGLLPRALATLRPAGRAQPSTDDLRGPRLPRWALRELKLVQTLRRKGTSLRAMRSRLGISVSAIRSRLRLAGVIGARALRDVRPARMTPGEVIKDRQAWIKRQEGFEDPRDRGEVRRANRHARRMKTC